MKEIRYCENCKYCKEIKRKHFTYLECTQFNIEVVEDDYCSFGGDLPEEDPWRDEPYELKKDERISSV